MGAFAILHGFTARATSACYYYYLLVVSLFCKQVDPEEYRQMQADLRGAFSGGGGGGGSGASNNDQPARLQGGR